MYTYSGIAMEPLPWTHPLRDLLSKVEEACSERFNSVLLNYYRNERDSMGMHSDDEPELGPRPTIASLSLGEERVFTLKPRAAQLLRPVHLPLPSGSLLLMKGDTQRNWKHGIAKAARRMGPRVNLTFRQIQSSFDRKTQEPQHGAA
jgi:alkylated DNA repair dioxygenase AlkB